MKNKKCPVTGGGARPFEFYQRLQQFTDVNQPILFPCWVERSIGSHLQFFAVTLSRQYPQKTICKWSGQRQLLLLAVINRVHCQLGNIVEQHISHFWTVLSHAFLFLVEMANTCVAKQPTQSQVFVSKQYSHKFGPKLSHIVH